MASPVIRPVSLPPPALWKRIIVRSLVGGAACGLVIAAAVSGLYFYSLSSKVWNKKALRTANVKAQPLSRLDDKFQEVGSGVTFSVDLENTTSDDITIPKTVTILQEQKDSHALHGSFLKLDQDVFLPSRHVVSLSLDSSDLCVAKYDPQTCFNSYFQGFDNIVLLDNVQKYEIRIPIPKLTIPSDKTVELPK